MTFIKSFLLVFFLILINISETAAQFDVTVLKDLNPTNFKTDFKEYNRKTAIYCAQLSNIVYESENSINNYVETLRLFYPDAGYKYQFLQHKPTSTEVMFFGNSDFVIVAFRGTQEMKDFKTDAKFLGYKTRIDSIKDQKFPFIPSGHAGFRKSLMSVIDRDSIDIFGNLERFITDSLGGTKEKMKVFLTGHSLGAALANLFILPLQGNGFLYRGSYNFATPLAIWKNEADKIIKDTSIHNVTYDIVNYTDYIARLPMYSRKNMKHIGKFYRVCYIDKDLLEPKIFSEKEIYIKYKTFEKFTPIKALYAKYHRMIFYLRAVSDKYNTKEMIDDRSSIMQTCSCLGVNKKYCED